MKKLTALLLTLCLLCPVLALAEAAPAYEPIDLGDFTLAVDPNMAIIRDEKTDGGLWFTLYPAYNSDGDASTNFQVMWKSDFYDASTLTDADLKEFSDAMGTQVAAEIGQAGLNLISFSVPSILIQPLGGKDALAYMVVSEVEYQGVSLTFYQLGAVVSDASFGTYTFTGTAFTMELLQNVIDPIFDAITFK